MINSSEYVWMDGKFVKWEDANVHVMTSSLHYGTSVLEGIRVYKTDLGPAIFKLQDHADRFIKSARKMFMKITFTVDDLVEIIRQLVKKNNLDSCYIRLISFFGYGHVGLNISKCPANICILCWGFDDNIQKKLMDDGVKVRLSSYKKFPSGIPDIKVAGNYLHTTFAKMEALSKNFDEAIICDEDGRVIGGASEDLFIIKGNTIITPSSEFRKIGFSGQAVMDLAKSLGYNVSESVIFKEDLEKASEAFLTGATSQLVPILQFNNKIIGLGKRGKTTKHLQEEFLSIVSGRNKKFGDWLTYV